MCISDSPSMERQRDVDLFGRGRTLTKGPIVLVDDNIDALRLAEFVFQEAGLDGNYILLQSGVALLAYLGQVVADGESLPRCVLLDISMPDMNGIEVLRTIRRTEEYYKVRVIMLTNSNDSDDQNRALAAGADGYQVKPFGLSEFVDFMKRLEEDPK